MLRLGSSICQQNLPFRRIMKRSVSVFATTLLLICAAVAMDKRATQKKIAVTCS
jgi:hypothetical protein